MKKRVGLIAGLFVLSLVTQAFALECSIDYDTKGNIITLEGTAKAPVFVTVLPKGVADAGILEGKAAATAQYSWHKLTDFRQTIMLDKDLPSGTYSVKVQSNEQYMNVTTETTEENNQTVPVRLHGTAVDNLKCITEEIYHINADDAAGMIADFNTVKGDADALYRMIATGKTGEEGEPDEERVPYTELLSIDPVAFATYGQFAAEQMVGTKDGADYTGTDEVIALLGEYRVLYEAIRATDPAAVIESNAAAFDADVERFVGGMDDASADALNVLLKNFKADGKALSAALPELSALASIQAADRWQTIEKVITDTYDDVLNIDYDVEKRDKVFGEMMYYEYNSFLDIADNFEKADAKINGTTTRKPSSNGGNGGGGGGGGAVGAFEIAPSRTDQRNEPALVPAFNDVAKDFWGYSAIGALAQKGIISGYPDGSFRPDGNVTRAEFVKMLTTAFGLTSDVALPFADVSGADWHYSYIRAAYGNGVISGVSADAFEPDGAITREDACVIVYRYLSGLGALDATKASFADEAEFAPYAADAIATLAGNGIVNGVGDSRFDSKARIDRASCAVLILNCLNAQ